MKTSIFKRSMALFLAFLLCFTTFAGASVIPVYASGVQEEVRMTSYPKTGDAQFSADWGHGDLHFMNGWSDKATRYLYVRAVGDAEGHICYCIEPGVNLNSSNTLTQRDESFWDNYPSEYNSTISPDDIKLLIGRILQYGFRSFVSTRWMSQNAEDANKLGNATATQLLIWETIVGERDADFNKVAPSSGEDLILNTVKEDNPLYSQIMSNYYRIEASVQSHTTLPSFMARSTGRAQNIELIWDGGKYTATLTDTNNVLSNYTFTSNDPSLRFSVSGNQLTITADTAPTGPVTITASKNNSVRQGIIT